VAVGLVLKYIIALLAIYGKVELQGVLVQHFNGGGEAVEIEVYPVVG
jgi:hypothetical protein